MPLSIANSPLTAAVTGRASASEQQPLLQTARRPDAPDRSSGMRCCGLRCPGWLRNILPRLQRRDTVGDTASNTAGATASAAGSDTVIDTAYLQEGWHAFLMRHFGSPNFNPGPGEEIAPHMFNAAAEKFLDQLKHKLEKSTQIDLMFNHLPEAYAAELSQKNFYVKTEGRVPTHVAFLLIKRTIDAVNASLREQPGEEKKVHIGFGRGPVSDEEGGPSTEGSSEGKGQFFGLPFDRVANEMAHVGTEKPSREDMGKRAIPGVHVSVDLSGLKLAHPERDLSSLNNLIIRANIKDLKIDLSGTEPFHSLKKLEEILSAKGSETLQHLTLNVPMPDEITSSDMGRTLGVVLGGEECSLKFLTLNLDGGTDEARQSLMRTLSEGIAQRLNEAPEILRKTAKDLEKERMHFAREEEKLKAAQEALADAKRQLTSLTEQASDVPAGPTDSEAAPASAINKRTLEARIRKAKLSLQEVKETHGEAKDALDLANKRHDRAQQWSGNAAPVTITVDGQQLGLPS